MTGSQFYAEYIYNAFVLNQLNAEFFFQHILQQNYNRDI